MKNITIFTGHYGSGKTEIALNYAVKMKQQYKKVYIVDLDLVNPYFRTVDAKGQLEDLGIHVIASEFAGTNVDMPTVPAEVYRVFTEPDAAVIFDVGGDEDGAIALGQYRQMFEEAGYDLLVVANCFRPMTRSAGDIMQMMSEIEGASRLKVTGLINNSNIAGQTTAEHVYKGQEILAETAKKSGVPLIMTCAPENMELERELKVFPIHRYLKLIFEA